MNENEKSELAKLQKEMAELKKLLDEANQQVKTEIAELNDSKSNKINEIESSGKLQGAMVCTPRKEDNRDNEIKTTALQGSCVDISSHGVLGVLKKLFGK